MRVTSQARGVAAPYSSAISSTLSLKAFLERAARLVQKIGAPDRLVVAIPTFADVDGVLQECPAIPALTGIKLADQLSRHLKIPTVTVVPDLAAASWGEYTLGSGRGINRFMCVAIGTGINAAAINDGSIVNTAYGCLGDAGHVIVESPGRTCTCGGNGCAESVVSGWAIQRAGHAVGLESAAEVAHAARNGNTDAVRIMTSAGTALGRAIASWSALTWPDVVAIAGGLSAASDLLLPPAAAELRRAGAPYITSRISLVRATLGPSATLAGCLQWPSVQCGKQHFPNR